MNRFKTKMPISLIIFFYLLFFSALLAQTKQDISYDLAILRSYGLEKVEENLTAQLETYPQEKIHLHTDRDFYVPGEKIWFKAYVVDAHTHLHPTYSEYVYVELISPADTLVQRVMIQQTDNMFYGHLPLSNIIPEGDYMLRAYTRYMENLGDDYFFKKNIRIENLSSVKDQQLQTAQRNRSRRAQTTTDDFEVSFFPEGGNLLEGVICKVAFKALNRNGYPEIVTGSIMDENGVEVTSVKTYHAGMGLLGYQPGEGKKFYLKCRNGNGLEKQFELPQPNPNAWSLIASMQNNRIRIGVQKSIHAPDMPCYLLAHCRGMALYFSEWDKRQEFITFNEEQLPAGVIQFVLFDGQMNPLSERLIFSKNDASAKVEFQTDKETYQIRDKIVSTLSFPDSLFFTPSHLERDGVRSHFSVAVTDDKDITVDESTTILSSLLLSSELKGNIENPAYYLQDFAAMDLLMMTHGWRRYNIPEVVKGNPENPQIPYQIFQTISGQVTTLNLNRPVSNSEILITMKGGGFGMTSTDAKGSFIVPELIFPDSTIFYIQALNRNGRDNVQLFVDQELFPKPAYIFSRHKTIDEETKDKTDVNAFMAKTEQRAQFDEDMWTLHLREVEVTAPKVNKDESRLQFWANESSDHTITRETFEKTHYQYVVDYLKSVPGVRVYGERRILIRGKGSFQPSTEPLILVDGMPAFLDDVNVQEVESIDVFKGGSAALFGARGANGVISITLKRGLDFTPKETYTQNNKPNQFVYNPLGYQKPVEFYSPNYEKPEARQSNIPDYRTTIFWKPDVVISEEGEASFEFYTSDFRTTYSVVIEGITNDGKIIRQVEKIVVSE